MAILAPPPRGLPSVSPVILCDLGLPLGFRAGELKLGLEHGEDNDSQLLRDKAVRCHTAGVRHYWIHVRQGILQASPNKHSQLTEAGFQTDAERPQGFH